MEVMQTNQSDLARLQLEIFLKVISKAWDQKVLVNKDHLTWWAHIQRSYVVLVELEYAQSQLQDKEETEYMFE